MTDDYTLALCKKMTGKSLTEMFTMISFDAELSAMENKQESIDWLNAETGNNYNINHLNNWIAERKPTPQNVKSVMRKSVIQYLFSDELAEMLNGIY